MNLRTLLLTTVLDTPAAIALAGAGLAIEHGKAATADRLAARSLRARGRGRPRADEERPRRPGSLRERNAGQTTTGILAFDTVQEGLP